MRFDSEKVSTLLRKKKMKQIDFADAIERHPSTVSLYLSGKSEPGRKALIAMSEVLDTPISDILKTDD
ncbi:helix-turn-helix domain-containing protein [Bacillus pacificus]|uniref:helix-turn-helix domain-containing protein n=1 Tax=Bacillus pacificus TaxID=2026187 RepID=UPI0009370812